MKYKNIIFDYGNTIVKFEPENIIKSFGVSDENDVKIIYDGLFERRYWDHLDKGLVTQKEFVEGVLSRVPERLHAVSERICEDWCVSLPYVPGMDELIYKLKNDGYKIYLLSNISKHFAERSGEIEIFKVFDGLVFSGEIKLVKPDKRIFEYILNKYSLDPAETVFADDNEENVSAASKMNITSFLFKGDAKKLESFIYNV